jgi:hypothetical protein
LSRPDASLLRSCGVFSSTTATTLPTSFQTRWLGVMIPRTRSKVAAQGKQDILHEIVLFYSHSNNCVCLGLPMTTRAPYRGTCPEQWRVTRRTDTVCCMSCDPDQRSPSVGELGTGVSTLAHTAVRDILVDFYTCVDILVENSAIALLLFLSLSPTLYLVLSNHRSSQGVTETSLAHALQ